MKKFSLVIVLFLMLALLLLPSAGYCGYNNWGGTDRRQLLSRELPNDLIYSGVRRGGVSQIVSSVSKLVAAHLAFGILELAGASKTFSIEAGEVGQEILLVKSETDGNTLKIKMDASESDTPNTTRWTSITFDTAAGSYVRLFWASDTLGWEIKSSQGVTIVY